MARDLKLYTFGHHPECTRHDEETGDLQEVEAWTQNWHRWEGVVIG